MLRMVQGLNAARCLALGALLLWGGAPTAGQPQSRVALPFETVDLLNGAKYKIHVPANWNGTLIVYLRGTLLGPPPAEPALVPPTVAGSEPELETTLLSRGYALAAIDYADPPQDALSLISYFRGRVADPDRTIVFGTSGGGHGAVKLNEENARAVDGVIATCAPLAGSPKLWDSRLAFSLAYAVAFGWPADQWGPIGDLKPGLNYQTDVLPVAQTPKPDGSNRGGWEFIRLVMGFPSEAWWGIDPIYRVTGWTAQMVFSTHQRAQVEAGAAGPFTENLNHRYSLTAEDKAYLRGLGINADDLLAKMNAQTNIAAAPWSRAWIQRYGGLSGKLNNPVIAMHTTGDLLASVANQAVYRDQVAWWDLQDRLVQVYVKAVGHCAFTSAQVLATIDAMENWLDTGARPDASFFPAEKGFNNQFVPPPWPF